MEQKITIQQFAETIARQTQVSIPTVMQALKDIFGFVSNQLHDGGPVEVPELGVFSLSKADINRIVFTPCQSLAEAVNAPFQAFIPVELSDEFDGTDSDGDDNSDNVSDVDTDVTPRLPISEDAETVPQPVAPDEECQDMQPAPQEDEIVESQAAECEPQTEQAQQKPQEQSESSQIVPPPIEVPPPFNPLKAYSPSADGYSIPEDEECYVENNEISSAPGKNRFINGLISGIVVAAAIFALALFVYEIFIAE